MSGSKSMHYDKGPKRASGHDGLRDKVHAAIDFSGDGPRAIPPVRTEKQMSKVEIKEIAERWGLKIPRRFGK